MMPGTHRGPTHKGQKVRTARFALDPVTNRAFLRMVKAERRSIGNMATVLIAEAIEARARLIVSAIEVRRKP